MVEPSSVPRSTATPRWRRLLRLGANDVASAVDDELLFHLEMRIRDLVAQGMSPAAARAEAERAFGDVRAIRRDCVTIDQRRQSRDHRVEVLHHMWQDITFAARTLRRSPGFAAAAIACIALGVGVTTTIFSAVNAILIRPLPYPDADQLVVVYAQNIEKNYHGVNISYPDYVDWRDGSPSFSALGMYTWTTHSLSGDGDAERVEGASVTANLFPLLGIPPLLGRTFLPAEQQPGQDNVVLLSYGLWQRRYGGDRAIVGRTIQVDGAPTTVIGVMPPGFNFPDRGQAWVPFTVNLKYEEHGNRGYAGAIGRLKPGATIEQARTELDVVSRRLEREFPRDNIGWSAELMTLRQDLTGDLRKPLLVFLGAVLFVLLIACANVANLMLARGATRQREIAVRAAIGAGRGRLVRQILTESLLIAGIGGAIGVVLAVGGSRLLRMTFPDEIPFYFTLGIDVTALTFAVVLSGLTALTFGTVPALRAVDVDFNGTLRDGTRGGDGLSRSRMRSALVVAEVALSLVLMVGAMLLIRSYRALEGTNLGFDEHGILSAHVSLPYAKYRNRADRLAFYDRLLQRVRTLPGVQSAGSALGIPFSGWNVQAEMGIEGRPATRRSEELVAHYQYVTPDYFKSIGVPLLRGRNFTDADRDSLAPVGLINELLAERAWPGIDPLGKRIRIGGDDSRDAWVTVVGVIRDFRHYRLPQPMGPALYFPYASLPQLSQTLTIRTTLEDPLVLAPAVRAAVRELDADVPVYQVQTFDQVVTRSLWRQRLQGQALGIFAALALLLAVVGIYGVISYGVAQRTRELGVRMALGATRQHVLALVLGDGTRLVLLGVVIGLAGALALTRVVASLLYGVRPTDVITFVGVPIVLSAVAFVASYIPARRAARVDPLVAMRSD